MSAAVRIGRVRFKSGADLRVIHNDTPRQVLGRLRADVETIASYKAGEIAVGYALVVWGREGATSTISRAWRGLPVPAAMIPDFARTCLADSQTHDSVIETLIPSPDRGA